jgi:hypothetical protein
MGARATTSVQFQSDLVWNVKKVGADRNILLGLRIDSPRFTVTQGDNILTLDGREPTGGEARTRFLRTWLHDLSRIEIACVVTPEGTVESASLPEETLARLKSQPHAETLSDQFGGASLKRLVGLALPPLPGGPVEKGGAWRQRVDAVHPFGRLTTDLNFTYLEVEPGNKHKVGLKSSVKLIPSVGSPATLRVKVNDSDGMGVFDASEGRWLELRLRQNVSLVEELGASIIEYSLTTEIAVRAKK